MSLDYTYGEQQIDLMCKEETPGLCITFHAYGYKICLPYHRVGEHSESSIVYSATLFLFQIILLRWTSLFYFTHLFSSNIWKFKFEKGLKELILCSIGSFDKSLPLGWFYLLLAEKKKTDKNILFFKSFSSPQTVIRTVFLKDYNDSVFMSINLY